MRLFVAIEPSFSARKEIEKVLVRLKKKYWPVRWEKPEKIHLTLVFLGEVSEAKIPLVKNLISSLKFQPFMVAFKGLGCFPNYVFPRVVWLGLRGDLKALAALQKEIQRQLVALGFKFPSRPFLPHLTLGRLKNDYRLRASWEMGRQLKAMQSLKFQSHWLVEKVILYQSQLLATGSCYQKLVVSS